MKGRPVKGDNWKQSLRTVLDSSKHLVAVEDLRRVRVNGELGLLEMRFDLELERGWFRVCDADGSAVVEEHGLTIDEIRRMYLRWSGLDR